MQIIDGRKIKEKLLEEVKNEVLNLSFTPVFCDVLVGFDPSSVQYVNLKKKVALSLGIKFLDASFNKGITTEELVEEIKKLNSVENMCGLIVQLPLPVSIDTKKVLSTIRPDIDVDCLGEEVSRIFYKENPFTIPPTAGACMYLLDYLDIDLSTKNIVILGAGELVGRPIARMLTLRNLSYQLVDKTTENKKEILRKADIVISGMGQGKYVTSDMVKEGVILIDAGTSESNGSIVGDVDFESVKDKASFITPVPGGVGPVTVAMLFKNVLQVAKNKSVNNSAIAESVTNIK